MNLLNALMTVRSASRASNSMRTKLGRSAAKTVDNKIQRLLRKKAWRDEQSGKIPVHMAVPREDFAYPIADDPVLTALKRLVKAQEATIEKFTAPEIAEMESALKQANEVIDELASPLL